MQALALVSGGPRGRGPRTARAWSDQPALPWDYLWAGFTAVRACTWAALGDPQAVADLRADLTPYADRFVVGSLPVFFLGSAHQVLGDLAAAAGDLDAARDHLTGLAPPTRTRACRCGWPGATRPWPPCPVA